MYCDESGNIFISLNNYLQGFLYPHPIIILISFVDYILVFVLCSFTVSVIGLVAVLPAHKE